MLAALEMLFVALYAATVMLLLIYALNAYILLGLFRRKKQLALNRDRGDLQHYYNVLHALDKNNWPTVTVQLPIYNERHVVRQLIHSLARLDYPRSRLELQILDDSTDDTSVLIEQAAREIHQAGITVSIRKRKNRVGYKAGALAEGLQHAQGEFIAIFDADFLPEPDFLLRMVPFLLCEPELGCVQGRWGHRNEDESLLTQVQAIGIDGHFAIEQSARSWNDLYLNFNGTVGVWRKAAIITAGGWSADTLTEDMDLSYRAQLHGWHMRYLIDSVAPGEIPASIRAFQQQQYRWAKGSIATAVKLAHNIISGPGSGFKKLQALLHMTHYAIHPLMLLSLLLIPWILMLSAERIPDWIYVLLATSFALSMLGPNLSYIEATRTLAPQRIFRRLSILPFVTLLGMGLSINNTWAVIEGLLGRHSEFKRTPKLGQDGNKSSNYRLKLNWSVPFEIIFAVYACWGFWLFIIKAHYIVGPFLGLYALGYGSMAAYGLCETFQLRIHRPQQPVVKHAQPAHLNKVLVMEELEVQRSGGA